MTMIRNLHALMAKVLLIKFCVTQPDQTLFLFKPPGVAGVSKSRFFFFTNNTFELKLRRLCKNFQIKKKIIKNPCFLTVFWILLKNYDFPFELCFWYRLKYWPKVSSNVRTITNTCIKKNSKHWTWNLSLYLRMYKQFWHTPVAWLWLWNIFWGYTKSCIFLDFCLKGTRFKVALGVAVLLMFPWLVSSTHQNYFFFHSIDLG